MDITFKNKKLEKLLSREKEILKKYGSDNGRRIQKKMTQLAAASNLAELSKLPATRLHPLLGDKKGKLSLDVKHPDRMLIEPDHPQLPLKEDGGLDWAKVTKVKILEITDTH